MIIIKLNVFFVVIIILQLQKYVSKSDKFVNAMIVRVCRNLQPTVGLDDGREFYNCQPVTAAQ